MDAERRSYSSKQTPLHPQRKARRAPLDWTARTKYIDVHCRFKSAPLFRFETRWTAEAVEVDDDDHKTRLVHVTPSHLPTSRDATWLSKFETVIYTQCAFQQAHKRPQGRRDQRRRDPRLDPFGSGWLATRWYGPQNHGAPRARIFTWTLLESSESHNSF